MTEQSIIERAARALCESEGHDPEGRCRNRAMWQTYEKAARAMLAAIKEPDEAMIDALEVQFQHYKTWGNPNGPAIRANAFMQAMIDAALK